MSRITQNAIRCNFVKHSAKLWPVIHSRGYHDTVMIVAPRNVEVQCSMIDSSVCDAIASGSMHNV